MPVDDDWDAADDWQDWYDAALDVACSFACENERPAEYQEVILLPGQVRWLESGEKDYRIQNFDTHEAANLFFKKKLDAMRLQHPNHWVEN